MKSRCHIHVLCSWLDKRAVTYSRLPSGQLKQWQTTLVIIRDLCGRSFPSLPRCSCFLHTLSAWMASSTPSRPSMLITLGLLYFFISLSANAALWRSNVTTNLHLFLVKHDTLSPPSLPAYPPFLRLLSTPPNVFARLRNEKEVVVDYLKHLGGPAAEWAR